MRSFAKLYKQITFGLMPPPAAYVYTLMADTAQLKDNCCYLSQANIAKLCCISIRSVGNILRALEYLELIERGEHSQMCTVKYTVPKLTPQIVGRVKILLNGGNQWERIAKLSHKKPAATYATIAEVSNIIFIDKVGNRCGPTSATVAD